MHSVVETTENPPAWERSNEACPCGCRGKTHGKISPPVAFAPNKNDTVCYLLSPLIKLQSVSPWMASISLFWLNAAAHPENYFWQDAATCWLPLGTWEKKFLPKYLNNKYTFSAYIYFNECKAKEYKTQLWQNNEYDNKGHNSSMVK